MKLASALLRRKELNAKVSQLAHIQDKDLFEVVFQRKKITENVDDLTARVPKLAASQVTEEYDYYARQLRLVDDAIQQANWMTDINLEDSIMNNYTKAEKIQGAG